MEQLKKTLRDKPAARWAMMLIVSLLMAANYYFYDALSPLKEILTEKLNFSSGDYGIFTGMYAFPNTFLLMAIVGGVILDKLGIRPTGLLFAAFMLIGACLTAYGASDYYSNGGFAHEFMGSFWKSYSPELKMMSLGMLIFGLGAETSIVVVSKILVKWFKGYEIALAFGLNLGIARVGTALAFNLSPRLILGENWTFPIWFAVMLLLITFLAFLIYIMYDIKLDRQQKQKIDLLEAEDNFQFKDLIGLFTNKSFLFITALCVTFYAGVFPFLKYAPDLFFNKYGFSLKASGDIASLLPYATAVFTPIFGWVVDRYGKSASLMIFGSLTLLLVHILFGLTHLNVYLLIILLGIAVSLVPAAMWPSVAKIIPTSRIGSAYGTMFSLQNLGLFAVPILAGYALDSSNLYSEKILLPHEVNKVYNQNFQIKSKYLNNKKQPLKDNALRVTFYILEADKGITYDNQESLADSLQEHGKVIWSEYDSTKTNNDGYYDIDMGTGNLLRVSAQELNLPNNKYLLNVTTKVDDDTDLSIYKGLLKYSTDSTGKRNVSVPIADATYNKIDDNKFDIDITITDTSNNKQFTVIKGRQQVDYIDGKIRFTITGDDITYANIDYLEWNKPDKAYYIKLRTPLNYTYTCLLFALFGFIGFFFALLLKHNDKTSGYGLELPSNAVEEKTEK